MAAISLSTACLCTAVREANAILFDSSIQKGIRVEFPYSNNFNRDTVLYAHVSGDTAAAILHTHVHSIKLSVLMQNNVEAMPVT